MKGRAVTTAAFLVAAITFLVYIPDLRHDFVSCWDDDIYVVENPYIRSFDMTFFRWAFSNFDAANYHPLTWISHALDYATWGLNPFGHHLTNNILHAMNTFLIVLLVVRLILNSVPDSRFALIAAATTGLLFGLHPIHVESVAWVSERKDVLCALFFLLSIMMYIRYIAPPVLTVSSGRSVEGLYSAGEAGRDVMIRPGQAFFNRDYLFSLGFFILALFSKPMAVTLPAVLLILDWHPFARLRSFKTFGAALKEKLPFFISGFAASVVAVLSQKAGKAIISTDITPLPVRFAVAARSVFSYLGEMIFPADLVPFYPYPEEVSLLSPEYLFFAVLAAGVSTACFIAARKQKLWFAAWGYYLITLLPVIGIIQVGFQEKADRYTYLPSLGPFLITGIAVAWVFRKTEERRAGILRAAVAGTAAMLLVLMSYGTIRQTGIWKNCLILWNYVLETKSEESAVAYYHRGIAYYGLGLFDRAIEDYTRAISLKANYGEAFNNRGAAYNAKGQFDRALEDYTRATAFTLDPKFYANRGDLFLSKGILDKAEEDFNRAIELDPEYDGGYNGLGMVRYLNAQHEKAFENFMRAIDLNPGNGGAFVNRGYVYIKKGEKQLARKDFLEACRLGNQNGCKAAQRPLL